MIGVFDSGMGGLTVVREIRKRISTCDILYYGDTKHAPYGLRSREELNALTAAGLQYLVAEGATRIVSACNSVSASLTLPLLESAGLAPGRFIEMVAPTVAAFRHADVDRRILLLATPATIASGMYQSGFAAIGREIQAVAIPELAGAIERGAPEGAIDAIVRDALAPIAHDSYNVLILACTHYPLALASFRRVVPDSVLIYDPAEAVAERVAQEWWPQEVGERELRLIISGESDAFRQAAAKVLHDQPYSIKVLE